MAHSENILLPAKIIQASGVVGEGEDEWEKWKNNGFLKSI